MTPINYIGYHGTDSTCVASIKANNFELSQKNNEWLGFGVYFFIEGIGCPITNASEWANNQAYSREGACYENYSVLSAPLTCTYVLNASTLEGINAFNKVRDYALAKFPSFRSEFRDKYGDNRAMWNFVSKRLKLDAVIHSLYIKHKLQRVRNIASNVPNSLVLCVKDNKYIDSERIDVIKEGKVSI